MSCLQRSPGPPIRGPLLREGKGGRAAANGKGAERREERGSTSRARGEGEKGKGSRKREGRVSLPNLKTKLRPYQTSHAIMVSCWQRHSWAKSARILQHANNRSLLTRTVEVLRLHRPYTGQ